MRIPCDDPRVVQDAGGQLRVWLRGVKYRRRGLRATTRISRGWVAGLAAAVVALVVVLAFGVLERISGLGDAFASLAVNVLTAVVLGVGAWLWFYSWTGVRARRRLRKDALSRPEGLFPIRPQVGSAASVVGRDQVVDDLAFNLSSAFRPSPQVIVGASGSGKTSVLLKLAAHFADRDVLPIVLSLRGVPLEKIDLAKLAEDRFREYIDPYLRKAEDADKMWRWMSQRRRIVVLADDLDRARMPEHASDRDELGARQALDRARRANLPTVVASRRGGVPPDLPEPPIELGPLDWGGDDPEAEAVATVLKRAGRKEDDADGKAVRKTIDAGDLLSNVFYIDVIISILRAGEVLPEPPAEGEHAVRIALLKTWRKTVRRDGTVPETLKDHREDLLRALERFASERLVPPAYGEQAVAATNSLDDRRRAEALRFGELTGILEVENERSYRFTHDLLHAYFAAAELPSSEAVWRSALEIAPDAARVQLALVLAAARSQDARFCAAVVDVLLGEAKHVPDQQRLLRAAAAAEVARAGNFCRLDDRIAAECAASREDASLVAKRAALDQLAEMTGDCALVALWEYAGDADYGVRWTAARKLVDRFPVDGDGKARRAGVKTGADAYKVLARNIRAGLNEANECLKARRKLDDWDREILPLKQMAWMLPSLRSRAREAGDAELTNMINKHVLELLDLEEHGLTDQKGLEASIAQGFKADARMHPRAGIDGDVRRLLSRRKTFWYSQLNLVHAVTLRARPRDDAATLIGPFTREERHPFVRAAAVMCKEALERKSTDDKGDPSDYVWDDEGVVVSRRPAGLKEEAIQLVGDITVLLNLNESSGPEQREYFAEIDELPHCLGGSRTRGELFVETSGCQCEFHLCPYRPAMNRMSAYREISRPFCLHQSLYAKPANARKWGSRVKQKELLDFWRRLASLARV